jgi:secretion/DNA translocation related TadE-like protein
VVALLALVWMVAMAVVHVGAARVARHRAQSAADLSALAAAGVASFGPEEACRRAETVADANGARIESCSVAADGVAELTLSVSLELPVLGVREVPAMARAGPAGPKDDGSLGRGLMSLPVRWF